MSGDAGKQLRAEIRRGRAHDETGYAVALASEVGPGRVVGRIEARFDA